MNQTALTKARVDCGCTQAGVRAWPVNADLGEDADAAWNSGHRRDLNSGHEGSLDRSKAVCSWSTQALSREGGSWTLSSRGRSRQRESQVKSFLRGEEVRWSDSEKGSERNISGEVVFRGDGKEDDRGWEGRDFETP